MKEGSFFQCIHFRDAKECSAFFELANSLGLDGKSSVPHNETTKARCGGHEMTIGRQANPQKLPGKLTCPLKINGWKMYFLLKNGPFLEDMLVF